MKLVVKLVAPLVAVLLAGVAAVAVAEPTDVRKVYPEVAADTTVCIAEKTAMDVADLEYQKLVRKWRRDLAANQKNKSVSDEDVRKAARKMYEAGIKLIELKYAEAKCRLKAGNDAQKVCKALVLDLHAMLDALPMRKELVALAEADWNAVKDNPKIPAEERDEAETNLKIAKRLLKGLEDLIADKRKEIAAEPACKGFPVERPVEDKPVQPAPPDDGDDEQPAPPDKPGDDVPDYPLPKATVAPPMPAQT
jgi:hypothetical protein